MTSHGSTQRNDSFSVRGALAFVRGLLTWVPGLRILRGTGVTGGSTTAEYCYGVWLKHLTLLWESGARSIPRTVAELGPGDSLGTGLAALLSGAESYYALDVIQYANPRRNLRIFDELVERFRARSPRPTKGWPDYDAHLDSGLFPSRILTSERLAESLAEDRLTSIRALLLNPQQANRHGIALKYMVPWTSIDVIRPEAVDLIISHSVLEHVENLEAAYGAMASWLRPGGLMTHQIDYGAHGLTSSWNGYRAWSEWQWKIVKGRRPFLINRYPHSTHMQMLAKCGFETLKELKAYRSGAIARANVARRWKRLSDDDLQCSGCFLQVRKPFAT